VEGNSGATRWREILGEHQEGEEWEECRWECKEAVEITGTASGRRISSTTRTSAGEMEATIRCLSGKTSTTAIFLPSSSTVSAESATERERSTVTG
jgi:hypothetical protein